MCEPRDRTTPATAELSGHGRGAAGGPSRRRFLKSSAALATGAAAAQVLSRDAFAQAAGAVDAELARVQGERRILLKGGVVLTLDRQVGDFAQADVLIEGGKIRKVRPNIEVSRDAVAVIDAANRIVIPGFVDTHSHSYQGLLRNILVNGLLNPDYNRDIQNILTPAYQATDAYAGMLVTALGFIDMGTTAKSRRFRTPRNTATPAFARCRSPASARSLPITAAPDPPRNIRKTSNACNGLISAPRTSCSRLP